LTGASILFIDAQIVCLLGCFGTGSSCLSCSAHRIPLCWGFLVWSFFVFFLLFGAVLSRIENRRDKLVNVGIKYAVHMSISGEGGDNTYSLSFPQSFLMEKP
jgi:hypothetical protein